MAVTTSAPEHASPHHDTDQELRAEATSASRGAAVLRAANGWLRQGDFSGANSGAIRSSPTPSCPRDQRAAVEEAVDGGPRVRRQHRSTRPRSTATPTSRAR